MPEQRQVYLCPVCRRKLILDDDAHALVEVPLPPEADPHR
jgi:hypothetical protein